MLDILLIKIAIFIVFGVIPLVVFSFMAICLFIYGLFILNKGAFEMTETLKPCPFCNGKAEITPFLVVCFISDVLIASLKQIILHRKTIKKRTQLWLKNLPELKPTKIVETSESTKIAGNWFNKGGKDRQKNRAKTFQGIAEAMAEQWG